MKRRVQALAGIITIAVANIGLVQAQSGLPSYVATPSAQAQESEVCLGLSVVRSGRFVPSVTEFGIETGGQVSGYRMVYGDGVMRDYENLTDIPNYTYRQPGTYEAQLFVYDGSEWVTSDNCKVAVEVEGTPLVGQATSCEGVDIDNDPSGQGGTRRVDREVKVTVLGQDNKERIGLYRVDFGDGTVLEQEDNVFFHEYANEGTYTLKANVKAQNAEQYASETGLCNRQLQVGDVSVTSTPTPRLTAEPTRVATNSGGLKDLKKQPETGVSTGLVVAALAMLGGGLGLNKLVSYKHG